MLYSLMRTTQAQRDRMMSFTESTIHNFKNSGKYQPLISQEMLAQRSYMSRYLNAVNLMQGIEFSEERGTMIAKDTQSTALLISDLDWISAITFNEPTDIYTLPELQAWIDKAEPYKEWMIRYIDCRIMQPVSNHDMFMLLEVACLMRGTTGRTPNLAHELYAGQGTRVLRSRVHRALDRLLMKRHDSAMVRKEGDQYMLDLVVPTDRHHKMNLTVSLTEYISKNFKGVI